VCVCVRARVSFAFTCIRTEEAHSLIYFNDFFRKYICTFTFAKLWDRKLTYNIDAGHPVSFKLQVLHTLTVAELIENFLVKKFLAISEIPYKSKAIYTWHFVTISNSAVLLHLLEPSATGPPAASCSDSSFNRLHSQLPSIHAGRLLHPQHATCKYKSTQKCYSQRYHSAQPEIILLCCTKYCLRQKRFK
jgi:hypothetical protein